MSNNPLVSIGLPTYNRAASLERAIESALTQDYQNIELIISNNASTDETEALCQEACRRDARIKYYRQTENQGPLKNFWEVLDRSTGKFFMWLGDDDWLDSSYIANCVQALEANPDRSLVCGSARYFQGGRFLLEGETINLLQSSGVERVLSYYEQVFANGAIYGVMRPEDLHRALPPNVLGSDWLLIAAMAFMGKVETLKSTAVNRNWEGVSRSLQTLTASLGISAIHTRAPQLSISVSACRDVAWKSGIYASLSRWARISFACRIFAAFWRKQFKDYWRAVLYRYCAPPILFAISIRNRLFKRDGS